MRGRMWNACWTRWGRRRRADVAALFITGTDTECGKTHVAAALLRALRAQGLRVAGYKPVAAGSRDTPQGRRNEDAEALLAASSPGFRYAQINPVALKDPIAPHLAAADEGQALQVQSLLTGAGALAAQVDVLVVEGAGGFLVPLNEKESLADLVSAADWPVILVVGMRLGCINHALLSAEAISGRGRLLGWVANVLPPVQPRLEDNIASLKARLAAPCLGVVRAASPRDAAAELDIDRVLERLELTR